MTDTEVTPEEVAAIVEQIERGSDPYPLPADLIQEDEPPTPAVNPSVDTPPDVNRSLSYQIMRMSVGAKIKLALKGNRDARNILIRDSSHIVPRFVLQNPRLTDEEIIGIARNRNIDTELLRVVGEHKEWSRNLQVRTALVTNPKTPVMISLRFVTSLSERELRLLAKSKNVPSAIASAAKRVLFQRQSGTQRTGD